MPASKALYKLPKVVEARTVVGNRLNLPYDAPTYPMLTGEELTFPPTANRKGRSGRACTSTSNMPVPGFQRAAGRTDAKWGSPANRNSDSSASSPDLSIDSAYRWARASNPITSNEPTRNAGCRPRNSFRRSAALKSGCHEDPATAEISRRMESIPTVAAAYPTSAMVPTSSKSNVLHRSGGRRMYIASHTSLKFDGRVTSNSRATEAAPASDSGLLSETLQPRMMSGRNSRYSTSLGKLLYRPPSNNGWPSTTMGSR